MGKVFSVLLLSRQNFFSTFFCTARYKCCKWIFFGGEPVALPSSDHFSCILLSSKDPLKHELACECMSRCDPYLTQTRGLGTVSHRCRLLLHILALVPPGHKDRTNTFLALLPPWIAAHPVWAL